MKIAALTSVTCPYIIARYSAFTNLFSSYSLSVVELEKYSATYAWRTPDNAVPYKRLVLSETPAKTQPNLQLWILLFRALEQLRPNVLVVCGYGVPGMLAALFWSLLRCKPVILLSESKEDDAPRCWWRETIKSWIVKKYQASLVGGQPHKRYLIKLGMPSEAIFLGYDIVGNDAFHPDKIKYLPSPLVQPYFLAINRLVPKKNLAFLISSYLAYRKAIGNHSCAWDLVICGDGELRSQIEQQITEFGIEDYIHLPGFLQQEELLPYFAHAKCFIHSSIQEQWGLVVNEAMAAGLPVLVSNRCGCFEDLVIEGVNGFGFAPDNQRELTNLMIKISSGDVDLQTMGQASLDHIQKFSPEYFAQGLCKAVEYTMTH